MQPTYHVNMHWSQFTPRKCILFQPQVPHGYFLVVILLLETGCCGGTRSSEGVCLIFDAVKNPSVQPKSFHATVIFHLSLGLLQLLHNPA